MLFLGFILNVKSREINRRDTTTQFSKLEETIVQESFECGKQLGLAVVSKIKLPNQFNILEEDNEGMEKLWGCLWVRMNLIDTDSKINEENLAKYYYDASNQKQPVEIVDENTAKYFVQQCKYIKGPSYGQTTLKIHNCMQNRLNAFVTVRRFAAVHGAYNKLI